MSNIHKHRRKWSVFNLAWTLGKEEGEADSMRDDVFFFSLMRVMRSVADDCYPLSPLTLHSPLTNRHSFFDRNLLYTHFAMCRVKHSLSLVSIILCTLCKDFPLTSLSPVSPWADYYNLCHTTLRETSFVLCLLINRLSFGPTITIRVPNWSRHRSNPLARHY